MTDLGQSGVREIARALHDYLAGAEEAARLRAYEVARDALAAGVGLLEVVADHHEALAVALSDAWSPEESPRVVKASAELLAESLGPYEMTHRGFKETNEALVQANQDLRRQVAERLQAEEAARVAGMEAERANGAKNEFLSRMSHELRTPLNAVLGFAQVLELDHLTSDQRDGVEQIIKAGRHLLELINEILDIARIEGGQLAVSMEPVPVKEVLKEAFDLVEPLATDGDIRLLGGASAPTRNVMADRQRLRQVLINLLSNAIKYNRPGGTVTASYEEPGGNRLRVAIIDTGPGIDPDKMKRLFSPFDRLGAEETGVEGVGLGLALSRRIVEAMGGRLEVQSQIGEGSSFTVELPLATATSLERPGSDGKNSQHRQVSLGTGTVLCIEDNPANLRLVERALQARPGIDLLSATRGGPGLELARERHPDLVLLDMQLPDMGGEEVLRVLRGHDGTRGIPVLVVSADATASRIEQALAAGATDYLTKPLDLKLFLEKVDRLLGVSPQAETA